MYGRALCLGILATLSAACSSSSANTPATAGDGNGTSAPGSAPPDTSGDGGEWAGDATVSNPIGSSPVEADGGVAGDSSSPPPAVACPTATWSPGDSKTISLVVPDGGTRSYDVYVGKNVTAGTAVPLLVNVHGLNNDPAIQAAFSQMNPVADANGFVVVYPAGLGASFNAGGCCAPAWTLGVDDIDFVRAVVADAESQICIDSHRVYETGFSNGGMMAYQLACNAADLFSAVAPTEGENVTIGACNPSHPMPLAAFESLGDPVVLPVNAQASVQAWATRTGCADAGAAQVDDAGFTCQDWSGCNAGAQVRYCTLPGGTHLPPAGSAPVIWSFLSQFSLP